MVGGTADVTVGGGGGGLGVGVCLLSTAQHCPLGLATLWTYSASSGLVAMVTHSGQPIASRLENSLSLLPPSGMFENYNNTFDTKCILM